MGVGYKSVVWNRQKKRYDGYLWIGIGLFLLSFIGFNLIFEPQISPETLIIRSCGLLALLLLHLILCIGPLARLDDRFLPLLYNRRHFGVSMVIFALIHGGFSLMQFHSFGNINPLVSLFTANSHYGSIMRFPFQALGFFALIILLIMAATSHDFWLKNFGPRIWKSLHMMVYLAYALLIMHVMLGVVQLEQSFIWIATLGLGMITVIGLHVWSAVISGKVALKLDHGDSLVAVCAIEEIEENKAKMILVGDENIAIFKYNGCLSAVNNVCKHQNGPLGEGRIVDGCITCPWHGYQYRPEDGCSPPPFHEMVATYELKLDGCMIYVDPKPKPEGTRIEPLTIPAE